MLLVAVDHANCRSRHLQLLHGCPDGFVKGLKVYLASARLAML